MMLTRFAFVLVLLVGCQKPPSPVSIHILPAANHGCEIICKDGIATITCPYKGGCKSEGECYATVVDGELRNRPACCPMYTVCRPCKCLKDGTYKGYFKDGICTYRFPL